jgi:putative salt-induced outer membrane protein YdiY
MIEVSTGDRNVRKTLLLCALLCLPRPALAQAPAAPTAPPPPPKQEGSAEFAFVGTTGNASTQTIGLNGEFIVRPDQWVITNKASFVRNESESELTAENFGYLFRAARAISPRLSAFGEYAYFRDQFAGVLHRNSLVGGVSYKVIDLPKHLFFTDAGLGYVNEKRAAGDDVSSATWSLGAGYKWKISPTAEFSEDIRMTGLFADANDWRLLQAAAVTAQLTKTFSLKLANTIRYAHEPVPGFKNTDTNTSVALVAKF